MIDAFSYLLQGFDQPEHKAGALGQVSGEVKHKSVRLIRARYETGINDRPTDRPPRGTTDICFNSRIFRK